MRKLSKRKLKKYIAAVAAVIAIAAGTIAYLFIEQPSLAPKGDSISLHMLDVSQGDSILITCGEQSMLVDAGERQRGQTVHDYIAGLGIKRLDYAVATHPHSDHIGGLPYVVERLTPKVFLMPDAINETKSFEDMLTSVEKAGSDARLAAKGDSFKLGDATVTVLSPEKGYISDNLNNYSLVLRVDFGKGSFLLMGDAEKEVESDILPSIGRVSVLKAGHHGSDTSSSGNFLDKITPRVALISVGEGNSYGHPSEIVLKRFEERGTEVYSTENGGNIIITMDKDGRLSASSER